ncbi:MAG: hypothetical protein AAF447_04625, partial [Myxococcota bacterium]
MPKSTPSSRIYLAAHFLLIATAVGAVAYVRIAQPEPLLPSPAPAANAEVANAEVQPTDTAATAREAETAAPAYTEILWLREPVHGSVHIPEDFVPYDPIRVAHQSYRTIENREAGIPVQCYTATGGESNPCYVCHTEAHDNNDMADAALQLAYAFSEEGLTNHWDNLFVDRTAEIDAIS